MEKLELGIFEIFTYILPGVFIFLSISLIIENQNDLIFFVLNKANNINVIQSILFLLASYLLGFKSQFVAYEIFKPISKKIWKKRMDGKETSFNKLENEITQIRHFSPKNFDSLHKWFALRGMCYGLFMALLLLDLVLLIRSFQYSYWSNQRLVILILFLILAILFLRRSVTFHEWSHRTIRYSMKNMDEFKKGSV